MTKTTAPAHNANSDHLNCQTWILKVYIHCEGCKKKVYKVLQSIDGVYKTVIDSQQHKAIVSGSVDGDTLVQKLLKYGKHAEVLPEPKAAADGASGNSKKKKQNKKEKDSETTGHDGNAQSEDEKEKSEVTTADGSDGGNDQQIAEPDVAGGDDSGGGKKKKKKKKKGDKNDGNPPPADGDTKGVPAAAAGSIPVTVNTGNVAASMGQLNLSRPGNQMVYAAPYDLAPYQNYYPTPAYGMSYSTIYPSAESSYYTPPMYGYAQSHPSIYYPPPAPASYNRRSAFDDHDDENENGRGCRIM